MADWQDLAQWTPNSDPHWAQRSLAAFDLDDTLTESGEVPAAVISALEKTAHKGWRVVLVTGRPAGWADALVKLLPFDGIVAENGAVIRYWREGRARRKTHEPARALYWQENTRTHEPTPPPAADLERARSASEELLKILPGTRVASDQPYRLYDLAIDFAEEIEPAYSVQEADRIRLGFERLGARAKVSSIHVNGWWGSFSKEAGLRRLLREWEPNARLEDVLVYVGDSPNDGPLFAVTKASVGVANVKRFEGVEDFVRPRYVTKGEGPVGAIELMNRLPKLG